MSPDERDKLTAAAIIQAAADRKRTKALARIAKLKAKQAGELRRMPLMGREALAFIWKRS